MAISVTQVTLMILMGVVGVTQGAMVLTDVTDYLYKWVGAKRGVYTNQEPIR